MPLASSASASARSAHGRGRKRLVLVGAGHAHVQVLRAFAREPVSGCDLHVVMDRAHAVYSGMVPGFVTGQYRAEELEIDAAALAQRAGARVVMGKATLVDTAARRLRIDGGNGKSQDISYDAASFNIGSTVAGLDLPGIRERALPTRPIGEFVARMEAVDSAARSAAGGHPLRIVVAGGGAGGVELACCLAARLQAAGTPPRVVLVDAGERLLGDYRDPGKRLSARVSRALERRGIRMLMRRRVVAADASGVRLDDGSALDCDVLLWVTGAVAHPLFAASGMAIDERGFALVRPTLQVSGHDELFAVGDCATLAEAPGTAKAGVYSVREGPVLEHNLRAWLAGAPLRSYVPQKDFLTLLNLGDGTAIGAKFGFSFEGRWVMRWKDRIDRRFMRGFAARSGDEKSSVGTADKAP